MAFARKTVFILGAGSSEKFPLGGQLVRDIVSETNLSKLPALHKNGVNETRYLEFIKQLKFADPSSIDAFLEENDDLINVGRLAIAYSLIRREDEDELFPPRSSQNNWYKSFADAIGITKFGKPPENNLSVFTYNYDRSLEQYLTRVIENRMRIGEAEAAAIRKKIPIYHLHGSLGSLDPAARNYRPYSRVIDPDVLKIASESIKIIHEQSDKYECDSQLCSAISEAEQIYFFGFGYHPVNMRRLMNSGLREKMKKKDGSRIMALRWGMLDHVWRNILKNQFEDLLPPSSDSTSSIAGFINDVGFGND